MGFTYIERCWGSETREKETNSRFVVKVDLHVTHHICLNEVSREFVLVFLEGLGCSSVGVCEALRDTARWRGYTNTFDLIGLDRGRPSSNHRILTPVNITTIIITILLILIIPIPTVIPTLVTLISVPSWGPTSDHSRCPCSVSPEWWGDWLLGTGEKEREMGGGGRGRVGGSH